MHPSVRTFRRFLALDDRCIEVDLTPTAATA